MIFQTQPVRWTYVPRLRSREGEGGATGSNRRTLYRCVSVTVRVLQFLFDCESVTESTTGSWTITVLHVTNSVTESVTESVTM